MNFNSNLQIRSQFEKLPVGLPLLLLVIVILFNLSSTQLSYGAPQILDPKLRLERVFQNKQVNFPVAIAFLDNNDILVADKDTGTINRIINGNMLPSPLLDVEVANGLERGLLGMSVFTSSNDTKYVFIYFTKAGSGKDGDDVSDNTQPLGSYVYRYKLQNNSLIEPKLLLYVDSSPTRPNNYSQNDEMHHVGGKMIIGPDKNLYVSIGDGINHVTQAENLPNSRPPDGTGGILVLTLNGDALSNPPLGNSPPFQNFYYAYGIRNSFGMDFDPLTKKLWMTDAGPTYGDEINLLEPGSNGGWKTITGVWKGAYKQGPVATNLSNLVDFNGLGKYVKPKLTWNFAVTPTAIKFLNTEMLGIQYENDLILSTYGGFPNNTRLYHFDLNDNRTELALDGPLSDGIVNTPDEDKSAIIGTGFGVITDIQVGPDGYLYLASSSYREPGVIYRIVPNK